MLSWSCGSHIVLYGARYNVARVTEQTPQVPKKTCQVQNEIFQNLPEQNLVSKKRDPNNNFNPEKIGDWAACHHDQAAQTPSQNVGSPWP